MSNWFYDLVRTVPTPLYRNFSHATVLGRENVPREGGFLFASNHCSYLDVMCLVKETPRRICWITLEEVAARPILGRFVLAMNAIPVRREHTGPGALRTLIKILRSGGVVGIFPEAGIRVLADSVLCGGEFNDGVVHMARMAKVPILPVMLLGSERFHNWRAWLPFAGTRYVVAFGKPISPEGNVEELHERLARSWQELLAEWTGKQAFKPPDRL